MAQILLPPLANSEAMEIMPSITFEEHNTFTGTSLNPPHSRRVPKNRPTETTWIKKAIDLHSSRNETVLDIVLLDRKRAVD